MCEMLLKSPATKDRQRQMQDSSFRTKHSLVLNERPSRRRPISLVSERNSATDQCQSAKAVTDKLPWYIRATGLLREEVLT